jgi:hypothetical protein
MPSLELKSGCGLVPPEGTQPTELSSVCLVLSS